MIERLIFKALSRGIEALTANPEALVQFFCDRGLEETEARKIKEVWQKDPPSVIHNYPRNDSTFPLFAVVLGNENETIKALDDFVGFVDAEMAEQINNALLRGTVLSGSIYTHQHYVMVYTEHPDVTIYYYLLAKYFLTQQRDFFKENGLLDMALSGNDMKPDPGYAPEWLFVRRLVMSSKKEMFILDNEKFPTLSSQITGPFVNNPDAEGGDVILPPGIEPGVSVYTIDEESSE